MAAKPDEKVSSRPADIKMQENIVERSLPLDQHWYERFERWGSFESFDYLSGDKAYRAEQKEAFLSGKVRNPNLDYPNLDLSGLEERERALLGLKQEILAEEKDTVVKQVYRWRLNEKIAEVRMLKTAASGDSRRFKRYSEFVFGKPSLPIFAYTVNRLRVLAEKYLHDENDQINQVASSLIKLLPNNLRANEIALPSQENLTKAQEGTLEEFGDLLALVPKQNEIFTSEGIKNVFQQGLLALKATGWLAVLDASKTAIGVVQEVKKIKIPESRKMFYSRLCRLLVHEAGTHVKRRLAGERTKLRLLGLGLDRYEGGEEGIAMMREQAIGGKLADFAGFDGHLAIGLAVGLDDRPRDFREVFEIMGAYFLFDELVGGAEVEMARKASLKKAWNRCVRTFRGTDCQTRGACFTKDIAYREGNIGVWEVIANNPDEMMRFSVGKYDPSNCRHLLVLEQLGITNRELDSLEKS